MKSHTPTRRRQLLDDTRRDLTQVDAILEAAMDLIHDSLNGHPRAARYDRDSRRTPLWCWLHERDHSLCRRDAQDCGGEPVNGHDPTGDAATTRDPAAAAQRRIDRHLRAIATEAAALAVLLVRWSPPSTDMQRPDHRTATAPDGWCTSCWRNDKKHEPTSTHYAGALCRFCGAFKKREGQLPTVPILELHHQGRNIYQHFVDEQLRRQPTTRRTA